MLPSEGEQPASIRLEHSVPLDPKRLSLERLRMPIRPEYAPPRPVLEFLVRCYRFVAWEWPHADRIQVPDEGFEQRFRESCLRHLQEWSISSEREFYLGAGLDTASGVAHEVDIIARHSELIAIMEMKNRGGALPGKNDVIVFFAKVLDYLAANPGLLSGDICLAFMSRNSFEASGLAACLGLGIHPVTPDLRPLPVLVDNALIMQRELDQGLPVDSDLLDRFDDFCAHLNSLYLGMNDTWMDNRCGYLSEDSLVLKAVTPPDVARLSHQLRDANSENSEILKAFKAVRATMGG